MTELFTILSFVFVVWGGMQAADEAVVNQVEGTVLVDSVNSDNGASHNHEYLVDPF